MREFVINKNDADQRVDKYLTKSFKKLPKSLMYKYIRNKKIKVNRQRCEISQRLTEGDTIQLYISEEFFDDAPKLTFLNAADELNVLYEDEHLLAVYKPANLLVHSDEAVQCDTLLDRIQKYLYKKNAYDPNSEKSFAPALCHRIDRNTEGIVLAAKTAAALREMNEKIRTREVEKHYLCIVCGELNGERKLVQYYRKDEKSNKAQISNEPIQGGSEVSLIYKALKSRKGMTLVDVDLLSGKSHQIRAQLASIHHPLLNDVKYQGKRYGKLEGQALCAYQVIFNFADEQGILGYLKGKTIALPKCSLIDLFEKM